MWQVASGQQRQVANGKWQLPGGKHGTSGKSLRSARTFPFASRNESESAAPIPEASLPRFVPQQLLRFQLPLGCRRRQRRSFAAAAASVAPRWVLLSLITTRVAVVAFIFFALLFVVAAAATAVVGPLKRAIRLAGK